MTQTSNLNVKELFKQGFQNQRQKKFGFSESVKSKKNNKQIPFFFLGPDNDWNKILDDELKDKLNKVFDKNLKEFSYNE